LFPGLPPLLLELLLLELLLLELLLLELLLPISPPLLLFLLLFSVRFAVDAKALQAVRRFNLTRPSLNRFLWSDYFFNLIKICQEFPLRIL
jgi:hypothetical protein